MIYIYTLKDPNTNTIRYVGKTKNLKMRYYAHCSRHKLSKYKSYKSSWILSLLNNNQKPIMEVLDEIEDSNWEFWEIYWISQLQTWGFDLTNMTKGGEGSLGGKGCLGYKHTEEAKKNISLKNSKPKSKEWIEKAAKAMRKTVSTPILQYSKENILIKEYESFYKAAEQINIGGNKQSTIKNIHACCNNKRKTAYNYIWKYKSIE